MCNLAKKKYHLNDELYDSVIHGEELGFTSFGNIIALPYTDILIIEETFVVVSILKLLTYENFMSVLKKMFS